MPPKPNWTPADAPTLIGKTAIVTGATGGLGYETALGLARQGATTILTGRNPTKGEQALSRIWREVPSAKIRFEPMDLADLASIARFAATIGVVDVLVNNAGVMGLPTRQLTRDGFEQQIGVNALSHFVLTSRLKNALRGGRVVSVASVAHQRGVLNLDDLNAEKSYDPMRAYRQSKLAMLVFALELQRRSDHYGWGIQSMAAHPGFARTQIVGNGIGGGTPSLKAWLIEKAFNAVAQSARAGALPLLYAAMAPEAQGGAYYGPTKWGETRGAPGLARIFPQAADPDAGTGLWALSERLTGVVFG
jgi:NAD(P)-dependent dehydrogenase (short-subunit alcohol dehydrogenase family)